MTAIQISHEAFDDQHEPHEPGIFSARRAPKDLMDLRAEFVKRMGWVSPDEVYEDDSDRYDESLGTIHLFKRGEDGAIITGMRLTEIESVYDSLSLEMLKSNPRMYDEVVARIDEIDTGAAEGGLWDLTRLVDAKGEDTMAKYEAMVEVFGAGMAATDRGNENLTWIFTTTDKIKHALDGIGIQNEILTQGYISEDDRKYDRISYVCTVKTIEAYRILEEHADEEKYRFAYTHVVNGRDTLSTL